MGKQFVKEKYLAKLLNILNISNSKLAKEINVDSSLVSKWINQRRAISTKSNYLEQISDYLSKNITNSLQKKQIMSITEKDDISKDIQKPYEIKEYIFNILLVEQQNTFQKNKYQETSRIVHIENEPSNINHKIDTSINNCLEINTNNNSSYKHIVSNNTGFLSNTFQIIRGHKEVLHVIVDLFKSSLAKLYCIDEPILMTLSNISSYFSIYENLNLEINETLLEVLIKGMRIDSLIKLHRDIDRNIDIIKTIQLLITTGRYRPYFLKNYVEIPLTFEMIIVPTIGALICFCNEDKTKIDSAFLFTDELSINLLSSQFKQMLTFSAPLINTYPTDKNIDFKLAVTNSEEKLGNKYVYKYELSNLTIPLNLYMQYMYKTEMSDSQISEATSCHKRRLEAFVAQIKTYKFYDICSKEAIEKMIKNGEYACNKFNQHVSFIAKPLEIMEHLQNVVDMLETYDNYEIGLLEDNQIGFLYDIFWMTKESHSVFLQCIDLSQNDDGKENTSNSEGFNNKINISITEPTIVNAYQNLFMDLWNEIAPINKDKKSVISWFKNQIKSIDKSYYTLLI